MYGLILWNDRDVNYASSEVRKVKLNNLLRFIFPHKKMYPSEIVLISFLSLLLAYFLFLITIIVSIVSIFITRDIGLPIFIIFSILVILALFIDSFITSYFLKKDAILTHMQMNMKSVMTLYHIKTGINS